MADYIKDAIVFTPQDVDLMRSPLRASLIAETYVLGAFNPGFTRLPNGNLLMMLRVAEALRTPVGNGHIHSIRWDGRRGFGLDAYPLASVNAEDPRKFQVLGFHAKVMALTSISWLLPVELDAEGRGVVTVHYEHAIAPQQSYQEYGVEDARISKVGDTYYMTTCSVSAERQCTTLYTSADGLRYHLQGIILDHQNKDMLIFEGMPQGQFHALTRPLGDLYFVYPPDSPWQSGPSINLARSPDALHWRPTDTPLIRPRKLSSSAMRIGGGAPPIKTKDGWLVLYHGVESSTQVGAYRTFWALLDGDDPSRVLSIHDEQPLLEARADLTEPFKEQMYLSEIVFTTGIVDAGDHYLVASGEADLLCRLTAIPHSAFR